MVVFVTMPFGFEGKRRRLQAEDALVALQKSADVVICFDNDRMGEPLSSKAGIHQAFANADQTIGQSIKAVCGLVRRSGLIHIGFDELAAALRNNNSRCVFGFGEAEGDNRAHEALTKALKNPLMDRGRMLSSATNVLVNVCGGQDLTLNEVQVMMDELAHHIGEHTQILFGATVDPKMSSRMGVTIISSVQAEEAGFAASTGGKVVSYEPPVAAPRRVESPPSIVPDQEQEPEVASADEEEVAASRAPASDSFPEQSVLHIAAAPPVIPPTEPVASRAKSGAKALPPVQPGALSQKSVERQETLQFEPVTRGRFEKTEPTIIDGEDLDVPTFLRRNVRIK